MPSSIDNRYQTLGHQIKAAALRLGFADLGITDTDLSEWEPHFLDWLRREHHGEMSYMARHGHKRTRPQALVPGTLRILSVRMNYYDTGAADPVDTLQTQTRAYVSRYALNRDYHKLMRKRLNQLAQEIEQLIAEAGLSDDFPDPQWRPFCDSAPVLERPLAQKAGLGFTGKNSLLIHPRAGSWFFLGELYTNLPLPLDEPVQKQGCGPCQACLQECPTGAIVGNGVVDARRCVSYLTIEYDGVIPEPLRAQMGNRIYGCDDCQLVCPWNRFSVKTEEPAFSPRSPLDAPDLLDLWKWSSDSFYRFFEGSPIRRIGYDKWRRNLCVALGNALEDTDTSCEILQALEQTRDVTDLLAPHLNWAKARHQAVVTGTLCPTPVFRHKGHPAQVRRYVLPPRIPVRAAHNRSKIEP
ncbi:tRNA epoxyqueuosine(34) reductase QueG [Hydrogenovibrio halophilus]|uniref:tRNA epoxyqueuosine(34) reductase QueG n=1 Tax=Hydrogenovibrio halophilus TaxID=373391 RepID=UPI0012FD1296|nr:tRNA epoxyqueuosine(34) reductase QueG [Hydrogenovibrio halophilus]